jgi:hypothetical protein
VTHEKKEEMINLDNLENKSIGSSTHSGYGLQSSHNENLKCPLVKIKKNKSQSKENDFCEEDVRFETIEKFDFGKKSKKDNLSFKENNSDIFIDCQDCNNVLNEDYKNQFEYQSKINECQNIKIPNENSSNNRNEGEFREGILSHNLTENDRDLYDESEGNKYNYNYAKFSEKMRKTIFSRKNSNDNVCIKVNQILDRI